MSFRREQALNVAPEIETLRTLELRGDVASDVFTGMQSCLLYSLGENFDRSKPFVLIKIDVAW